MFVYCCLSHIHPPNRSMQWCLSPSQGESVSGHELTGAHAFLGRVLTLASEVPHLARLYRLQISLPVVVWVALSEECFVADGVVM